MIDDLFSLDLLNEKTKSEDFFFCFGQIVLKVKFVLKMLHYFKEVCILKFRMHYLVLAHLSNRKISEVLLVFAYIKNLKHFSAFS